MQPRWALAAGSFSDKGGMDGAGSAAGHSPNAVQPLAVLWGTHEQHWAESCWHRAAQDKALGAQFGCRTTGAPWLRAALSKHRGDARTKPCSSPKPEELRGPLC